MTFLELQKSFKRLVFVVFIMRVDAQHVVGLRQVQPLEVQPELTDVVMAGFDLVRAGPACAETPGVSDVPEAEAEGG